MNIKLEYFMSILSFSIIRATSRMYLLCRSNFGNQFKKYQICSSFLLPSFNKRCRTFLSLIYDNQSHFLSRLERKCFPLKFPTCHTTNLAPHRQEIVGDLLLNLCCIHQHRCQGSLNVFVHPCLL